MPDIDGWAGNEFPLSAWSDDADQGVDTARLIADKSTSITVIRAGVAQTAQTVRLEFLTGARREYQTEAGQTGQADVLVLGYKGHPSLTDTDLQRGDRFATGGQSYEIVMVAPGFNDSLQAYARVRA